MRSFSVKLLLALALLPMNSHAQILTGFGVKAGAAIANQSWNESIPIEFTGRWGIDAALFAEAFQPSTLTLLIELHYIQKGFVQSFIPASLDNLEGTDQRITYRPRIDYLSLPILAKLTVDAGLLDPYVFAGPRLDIPIGTSSDGFPFGSTKFTKGELGLSVGAGIHLPVGGGSSLLAEVRYSPNFTDSFSRQFLTVKNISFEILAGIEL